MTGPTAGLPAGFRVGHHTDAEAQTGCTVVLTPAGTRGAVDVRGGGTGSRELDLLSPGSNPKHIHGVVLTGGSAFGLAAADGVMDWLVDQGIGHPTPAGIVPLVPAAVIYDLMAGDPEIRPDASSGRAACDAASGGVPARGRIGGGTGAAVAKLLGRDRAQPGGVGFAATRIGDGSTLAVIAVVNAVGDIYEADGTPLAVPVDDEGNEARSADRIPEMAGEPDWVREEGRATTLVAICSDAGLSRRGCIRVAQMATAGMARAINPVFSPVDGDVAFCLDSGEERPDPWLPFVAGTAAANLTAEAIRDAVRVSAGLQPGESV